MSNTFIIAQIILGILLTITILMQNRGSGMGSAWGGGSLNYHSRRGFEKLLTRTTIVLAALFVITSLMSVLVTSA